VGVWDARVHLLDVAELLQVVADGVRTPDTTFRQVASWGQLDVDAKDANGETALLRACRSGNFEFVVWLLKAAKPNAACKTVLQACQLVKLLKRGGADPNTPPLSPGYDFCTSTISSQLCGKKVSISKGWG
jgi:ankyrin repeat protein